MKNILLFLLLIMTACSDDPNGSSDSYLAGDTTTLNQDTTTLEQDSSINNNYLALGNSYTIGESVAFDMRWPTQLADSLSQYGILLYPEYIARTGWRTDDLINAINTQEPKGNYELVSLLIGVNNQYQGKPIAQYEEEFEQLIQTAISLTKNNNEKRVLVLSIPDYGYTPFGEPNRETISRELDEYNQINRDISTKYEVWYINITPVSRNSNDTLVADDNLHPSGFQYSLWVKEVIQNEAFVNYLKEHVSN